MLKGSRAAGEANALLSNTAQYLVLILYFYVILKLPQCKLSVAKNFMTIFRKTLSFIPSTEI